MGSEGSPTRLSFSDDLDEMNIERECRRDSNLLESTPDFEFTICSGLENHQTSLADELFADGMILPIQLQEHTAAPTATTTTLHLPKDTRRTHSLPPLPCPATTDQHSKKGIIKKQTSSDQLEEFKGQPTKSFWGFKRSSSLNCDIKKSIICSLPLLSRSNSTGSVPDSKKTASFKDGYKQNYSQKQQQPKPSASTFYVYSLPQKPPLKKSYGSGSHGSNVVRISPVLNVPSPYIPRGTANLFGLGSLLRNGSKEKKNKK